MRELLTEYKSYSIIFVDFCFPRAAREVLQSLASSTLSSSFQAASNLLLPPASSFQLSSLQPPAPSLHLPISPASSKNSLLAHKELVYSLNNLQDNPDVMAIRTAWRAFMSWLIFCSSSLWTWFHKDAGWTTRKWNSGNERPAFVHWTVDVFYYGDFARAEFGANLRNFLGELWGKGFGRHLQALVFVIFILT